jgi:predicted DNA-binding transcriptional regulator AlpA
MEKTTRTAGGKNLKEVSFAARNWDSLPDTANVDVKTVATILGRSTASIWRDVASGRLPQPKRFTARCSRWPVGVIRVHLKQY